MLIQIDNINTEETKHRILIPINNKTTTTIKSDNRPTQPNTNKPKATPVRRQSSTRVVTLGDEETIRSFIQAVRRDDDPTNWCLVTYDAPKSSTLILLGKGEGGVDEMLTHIRDDIVAYGLIRQSDRIDLSETVKFCFIDWRGPNINYMQRAQLGTHSGFVTELFHPYHVDVQTSDISDLNEHALMDKIRHASGAKSHVLG